jgi:phosphatidylserine/phosphatidylglycerophosphate/cardiolipin synthase-like enzyme/uncharacterized membrane protein YdjX (TVP38/TMEM64 family)
MAAPDNEARATTGKLLVPGRNCWRVERAHRLAFLIDAAPYFAAVRSSIAQAKRSVYILGWDFDSRIRLVPDGANDGFPEELGPFLREVVKRERNLRMYVLSWDFVMLFAGDREFVPLYKLGWKTHARPRLAFRLDDKHPVSGSHHQKVVVVDDAVAFCGGLDLTHGRWDTPEHLPVQPRRLNAKGELSRPNHDVQAVVDGDAARALGDLFRDRWERAAGRPPRKPAPGPAGDPWPAGVTPEVTDLDVAIARTDPGFISGKPVEEIRQLYVDAITSAEHTLYLENQYFSSSVLGATLEARLREAEGPEVVVVSRLTEEGWLEERTMGVLRARLHRRLQRADAHGRYRLLYPCIPGLVKPNLLNVHSKVLIADDELCSVGSANFNNRSMGFDTECNIAIEARGEERIRRAIAGLRNRLLAEHLVTDPAAVAAETARHGGSIVQAIEALKRPGRTLMPVNPAVSPEEDALLPAHAFIDPERPIDPEAMVYDFVPPEAHRPLADRVAGYAAALILLAALGAAWRWTPLREWIAIGAQVSAARDMAESAWAPLVVALVYGVSALIAFPISMVVVATGVVFGPLAGGFYAFGGAMLNAGVAYTLGWLVGRHNVRRLAGLKLNRITRRLARRGALAVALIRLLPIASYWKVNIVSGASYIRVRDFLIGTALGIVPPTALTVIFVDRAEAAIEDPGAVTFALLAGITAILVGGALLVWRRFGRDEAPPLERR